MLVTEEPAAHMQPSELNTEQRGLKKSVSDQPVTVSLLTCVCRHHRIRENTIASFKSAAKHVSYSEGLNINLLNLLKDACSLVAPG